jgi:hypothetical protein
VIDGVVRASIENVLLIRPHHRSRVACGCLRPLISVQLIGGGVPEDMIDWQCERIRQWERIVWVWTSYRCCPREIVVEQFLENRKWVRWVTCEIAVDAA